MPVIISIEANIGCGKTTLLEKLEKSGIFKENVVFMKEPVDIWEKIKDDNTSETMLSKFYNDIDKYSFPFQIMAYITRLHLLKKTIEENPMVDVIICERSLNCDKEIFAKMLYEDGKIENILYNVYLNMFEMMTCYELNGIIYLHTEPAICQQRIKQRNRNGEDSISLEYLEKCQKYHEDWLKNDNSVLSCPVLDIDATKEIDDTVIGDILRFMLRIVYDNKMKKQK